ncbi:MAG: S9 family peptidase [Acidobacteriota bacterium]
MNVSPLRRKAYLGIGGALGILLACRWVGAETLAQSSDPPLVPIEQWLAEPQDAAARLSPDGRLLAYLALYEGKANVWVRSLPNGEGRPVSRETERPIDQFFWSADGRRVLYLVDRGGDENFHLYCVPVGRKIGPARDLSPYPGVQVEIVSFPVRRPGIVVATLNRRDPSLADAYRIDQKTGALEIAAENPGAFIGYLADERGQVRVAWSLDGEGRYELWSRPAERRPWRKVRTYAVEGEIKPLRFDRDGRRIYLVSNQGRDLSRLALLDLETGVESEVNADPLARVDLDLALFDEATGRPIAIRYFDDRPRWVARHPKVEKALALAGRARRGAVTLESWSVNLDRWIVTLEAPDDPGATYLLDISTGAATRLSESRPWLASFPLADMEPIRFTSRDGLALTGYLTRPPGSNRRLPLVLAVHGGPWSRDRWGFSEETQLLANRGYAVLQVNFRGSVGFGKRLAQAARKEFGRAMQNDLLDAVAWAVDAGIADPKKVAILGGSYGGYAVLEGLGGSPSVFACGVDYAGPSDLVTLIEAFPPSWRPFLSRRWYPFVGNPALPADREDLLRRSPLGRADSITAPLLIFQGANDPRVTREQSDAIFHSLQRRNVPVTYLLAENEGHSFGNRETSLAVRRATEVFLARCLGGREQPSVAPEVEATLTALTQTKTFQ